MTWLQTQKFFVPVENCKDPLAIFVNTYTGAGLSQFPPGQWNVLDLSSQTSNKAIWALLSGILIITHGSAVETADITLLFRNIGNTINEGNYHGQSIETSVGNGQRSTYATGIPLTNGKCEFYWDKSTGGSYPTNSSYGINLSVQAFAE